jgi:hypothetical protein
MPLQGQAMPLLLQLLRRLPLLELVCGRRTAFGNLSGTCCMCRILTACRW